MPPGWCVSRCSLIALMAVVEHSYGPKPMVGVWGLSPRNVFSLTGVVAASETSLSTPERSSGKATGRHRVSRVGEGTP